MAKLKFKGVKGQRGVYSLNVLTPSPVLKPRPCFQDAKHPAAILILGVMLRSLPSSPCSHLLLVFISAIALQHANLSCADSTACGSMWWIRSSNWSRIKKEKEKRRRWERRAILHWINSISRHWLANRSAHENERAAGCSIEAGVSIFGSRRPCCWCWWFRITELRSKPFWNHSIFMF